MKRFLLIPLAVLALVATAWAAEVQDLSGTDANNNGTAANAGFPEGMAPSDVNNAARALEGMIARWYGDTQGALVAGGVTGALTLTPDRTISALTDGDLFAFTMPNEVTGSTTLNVSSLGAKPLKKDGNTNLASGDLVDGQKVIVAYDGTHDTFQVLSGLTLSFGTASTADTGTSGHTLPYLDGSNTWGATQNLADNILQRPVLKDYGETVNAIGDFGGGTQDIDLTSGNVVSATVSTSTVTFTFSNPPASGTEGSFTLILTNGGSQTVNWPASVKWPGGTAASLTASGTDILVFFTLDAGTTWYGLLAGANMS